jgi:hypothetical protein
MKITTAPSRTCDVSLARYDDAGQVARIKHGVVGKIWLASRDAQSVMVMPHGSSTAAALQVAEVADRIRRRPVTKAIITPFALSFASAPITIGCRLVPRPSIRSGALVSKQAPLSRFRCHARLRVATVSDPLPQTVASAVPPSACPGRRSQAVTSGQPRLVEDRP